MVSSKIIFLSVLGVLAIVASTDAACCHCPTYGLCVDGTHCGSTSCCGRGLSRDIWSGYISGPAGPIMSNINGPPGPFMLS